MIHAQLTTPHISGSVLQQYSRQLTQLTPVLRFQTNQTCLGGRSCWLTASVCCRALWVRMVPYMWWLTEAPSRRPSLAWTWNEPAFSPRWPASGSAAPGKPSHPHRTLFPPKKDFRLVSQLCSTLSYTQDDQKRGQSVLGFSKQHAHVVKSEDSESKRTAN